MNVALEQACGERLPRWYLSAASTRTWRRFASEPGVSYGAHSTSIQAVSTQLAQLAQPSVIVYLKGGQAVAIDALLDSLLLDNFASFHQLLPKRLIYERRFG